MSVSNDATVAFLDTLTPHLNADRRKGIESLKQLLEMFPGQALPDIEKSIRSLLAGSRTSVPAMIQRAKDLVQAEPGDQADAVEAFLKDASKCAATDLQAIAAGIQLPVPKQKAAIIKELRQWIESKGTYAPKSALDKKKERARELVGDLPQRLGQMTTELAGEIARRAEAASKDKELGTEGFVEFASLLLGTPMKGSKPVILKQIKAFVDRLVVSNAQTSSY